MRLLMPISFLSGVMAAFDACERPNGVWAGFDQVNSALMRRFTCVSALTTTAHPAGPRTVACICGGARWQPHLRRRIRVRRALPRHGWPPAPFVSAYCLSRRAGSLSFATSHSNGDYYDHLGAHAAHKSHTDVAAVTAHHETGSFAAPDAGYANAATSRYGMDTFIYKLDEATGQPIDVYGIDMTTSDGKTDGTSENDYPYGYPTGIHGFDGEPDMIAVSGFFMGKIKFPKADGTTIDLMNPKKSYWDGYVAKIDMATKSVVWATGERLEGRGYNRGVVTTAAGHVVTASDGRASVDGKSVYSGNLTKFNGGTGDLVWQKNFGSHFTFGTYTAYTKLSLSGENLYLSGKFKGKDSTVFAPAQPLSTSCGDGEDSSVVVAGFDVSSVTSDGPVAMWVTKLGCGKGATTFVEGNNLYVYGWNEESSILPHDSTSTAAKCTMSGALGGFLVKLNKADGKCLWAVDTGSPNRNPKMVANADAVWISTATSGTVSLDTNHVMGSAGGDYDLLVAKYQASDGAGLWGRAIGSNHKYMSDLALTPTGPIAVGYSQATTSNPDMTIPGVTVTNLQMQAAQVADPAAPGPSSMFVMQISSTDVIPSCLASCTTSITDATVAPNKCYADEQCMDAGSFSTANPCFRCDPATPTAQKALTTVLDNHCFIDNKCIDK